MNCSVCGTRMLHYENPDRDFCPDAGSHDRILAERRSAGRGTSKGADAARQNLKKANEARKKKNKS